MLFVALLAAADWSSYKSGPFEVLSDKDKKHAQSTLNHLEQLRWAFEQVTGKKEPRTLWPVRIVVQRGPSSPNFRLINDGFGAVLGEKEDISRTLSAQLARILIEDNLGRMPAAIERGLVEVLSTAEVSGTHVILGQPPAEPTLDWARVHMLVTSDEYRGRVKVFFANLEKGVDPDVAARNGLGKPWGEIEKEAKAHFEAKVVPTYDLAGKPVSAARDYYPREIDASVAGRLLKPQSDPDTAMGLFAAGKFQEASQLKPDWPEPWKALAKLETDPGKKAGFLKKACELSPRDAALWTEFALLMHSYNRFADADKAWAGAEKAAGDPEAKREMQARRAGLIEARLDAEEAARREEKLAKERELQRLKNEATARVLAAEAKANAGRAPLPEGTKVEKWWDGPKPDQTIVGKLARVDCLGSRLRLAVLVNGKTAQLLVPDPSKIVLEGGGTAALACGAQRPARNVAVEYFGKADPKTGTVGEAAVIRF